MRLFSFVLQLYDQVYPFVNWSLSINKAMTPKNSSVRIYDSNGGTGLTITDPIVTRGIAVAPRTVGAYTGIANDITHFSMNPINRLSRTQVILLFVCLMFNCNTLSSAFYPMRLVPNVFSEETTWRTDSCEKKQ